jgi:dUTPase
LAAISSGLGFRTQIMICNLLTSVDADRVRALVESCLAGRGV